MLEIDGSQKSGSGTIVRDAIPFAILVGEPIHLKNIRANRDKPGLRPQHLKVLHACADLCQGRVDGAAVGAREITFRPGPAIKGGRYRWDIGTAGSTTMLSMAILPLALWADGPSTCQITGGLFQDFAPSAFHLQHVLLPILSAMGVAADLTIVKPGYVPQGEGRIELTITPVPGKLRHFVCVDQGQITEIRGIALSSLLKERRVSERMASACQQTLQSGGWQAHIEIRNDTKEQPAYRRVSVQAGAGLAIWAKTDTGCIIGSDMAGKLRRSAEFIGEQTAQYLMEDLRSGATVDRHLADQVIPYAALAQGRSTFRIPALTDHVKARLWLAETILGARTELKKDVVSIEGIGFYKQK